MFLNKLTIFFSVLSKVNIFLCETLEDHWFCALYPGKHWKTLEFSWHKPWKINKNTQKNLWKPWNLNLNQNALSQWDCRILKSATSKEKIDESNFIFAWWYRFKKQWFVCKFLVGHGQKNSQPIRFQYS